MYLWWSVLIFIRFFLCGYKFRIILIQKQQNTSSKEHQARMNQKKVKITEEEHPKEEKQCDKTIEKVSLVHKNIEFYLGERVSEPSGATVSQIIAKWGKNYELLQKHHGFIQWLFPNRFQSRFNPLSQPLTEGEIKEFLNNEKIAKRYVDAYVMMLEFYGMKIKDKKSGEIIRSRNPKYSERYEKTLLGSFHNHMRISRILSSLVCVGFGRYAKQLSLFLNKEINSLVGGMKDLKKYGIYEREWKQYAEYIQKQSETNEYLKKLDKK